MTRRGYHCRRHGSAHVNLPLSVVKIGFSTSSRLALMQDAAGDLSRRRIESGQLFLPLLSATETPT